MEEIAHILNDKNRFSEVCQAIFKSCQTEEPGLMRKNELAAVMTGIARDLSISAPSENDVDELFSQLDKDNSGAIDSSEFEVLMRDIFEAMNSQ